MTPAKRDAREEEADGRTASPRRGPGKTTEKRRKLADTSPALHKYSVNSFITFRRRFMWCNQIGRVVRVARVRRRFLVRIVAADFNFTAERIWRKIAKTRAAIFRRREEFWSVSHSRVLYCSHKTCPRYSKFSRPFCLLFESYHHLGLPFSNR